MLILIRNSVMYVLMSTYELASGNWVGEHIWADKLTPNSWVGELMLGNWADKHIWADELMPGIWTGELMPDN